MSFQWIASDLHVFVSARPRRYRMPGRSPDLLNIHCTHRGASSVRPPARSWKVNDTPTTPSGKCVGSLETLLCSLPYKIRRFCVNMPLDTTAAKTKQKTGSGFDPGNVNIDPGY